MPVICGAAPREMLRCVALWLTLAALFIFPCASLAQNQLLLSPEKRAYLDSLGPITVCPDPDWAPFEWLDADGHFQGIAIDLLELLAQRLGIEFSYVVARDWDDAIARSQAGEVLILPFLNQTPAREAWLLFTEPLLVDHSVFITHADHPFITDASRLHDEIIVLPQGTSVEERIRADFPNLRILQVSSEKAVFQALLDRHADLTLRSLSVAAYTIRKEGLFNLKIAGQAPPNYTNRLRMGVLHTEPLLRDILNQGIATITDQEREEIINRHINIAIIKPLDYGLILRVALIIFLILAVSVYWNLRLKKINAALSESERSKSVLLANLPGVAYRCRFDADWTMEFISEGCQKLTGYCSEDLLDNRHLSFNQLIYPEDRDWIWNAWQHALSRNEPVRLEYRIRTADQQEKWVFEQGVFVDTGKDEQLRIEGLIIDITERKRIEEENYQLSVRDHLTGLYNRRYLFERLTTMLSEHQREEKILSLAIIDLDFFKVLNDTHGHQAGDYVLQEFAALMNASFRAYDLVGRYGGEEFMVICGHCQTMQMLEMLKRLRSHTKAHVFSFNGVTHRVSFSAGIASSSPALPPIEPRMAIETLISQADHRLYQAKAQGRDCIIPPA